tara:strand:- start:358 stop:1305 length:948 start_codon:yes stop_codon:yes gene_type:complete
MKWFLLLVFVALIVSGILNKEKLPFWNKEKPRNNTPGNISQDENEDELDKDKPNLIKNSEPDQVDPIEEKYPIPDFKPIEELVGNWKKIPASAFPRQVTLKAKAKYVFAGGAGSSTAPAGGKTFAISLSGDKLVITPNKQSNVRGTISINDTNYKEILGDEYEKYKQRKKREVYAQRERARAIAATEVETNQTTSSTNTNESRANRVTSISRISKEKLSDYENEIGKMPEAEDDGRVSIMVRSISSGDVTEIKLNEISYWGPIRYEIVDNRAYWTATVNYKTTSLFGTFPTEAMALMRNGKVENWLYTGSLEEVP